MNTPKALKPFRDAMLNQFDDVQLRRIADLEKALEGIIGEEFYDRHHVALWNWLERDAVCTMTADSWGGLARFIRTLSRLPLALEASPSMKKAVVTYGAERMARIIIDSQQKETT